MTLQFQHLPTVEQLRERFVPLDTPRVLTLPDELRESLDEITGDLDMASWYLGDMQDVLDSGRANRLLRRRSIKLDCGEGLDLEPLYTLQWLLEESAEQVEALTGALGVLLEPVRDSRTRYGVRTGILATAPYDWGKCGTPAAYQAHRRRGQDCQVCRKAAARYEADRRRRSGTVGALSL